MSKASWVWLIIAAELLAYELTALVVGWPLLTTAMRAGADRWLLWSAVMGTLGGHFFGISTLPAWCAWFIMPLGIAVLMRDLLIRSEVAPSMHLIFFLLFTALGALLWGSR